MSRLQNWIMAIVFVATMGGSGLAVALPSTSYAACNDRLLTFPAWFRGLTDNQCDIKRPDTSKAGLSKFVWTIALNIIEILLQLIGYMSAGFIIFGGFKYIISTGSSDAVSKARQIIYNAVIGLVISIFSVAVVNLVAGALK